MTQEVWAKKVSLFRKRFGSREDIFGAKFYRQVTRVDPATGENATKEEGWFMPMCDNYGDQKLCQIAQDRGGCHTCPNKKYSKLTDEWVWKHIDGKKELILYLVQDGGIKFGACDFDRGDPFEDAVIIRNYSVNVLKLPCYIARSSKKGYHVYWFFKELVPAYWFTSMVRKIYTEVGIYERSQTNPDLPVPEIFPKQTQFDAAKIGNGIKIPMIQPKMKEGFNCWVDMEAKPLPLEKQWEYFEACQEIEKPQLERVLQDNKIEILMQPTNRSKPKSKKMVKGPNGEMIEMEVSHERSKKRGDFNQIIQNCPALKVFWEKDPDGNYIFDKTANENGVPHTARYASLALGMATENGVEIIRERWKGDRTDYFINHAEEAGYLPVTCRWMQENNLCKKGVHPKFEDHCFKKEPPKEIENGTLKINPEGLPESEWPEPSPVRLATFKERLTAEQIEERLRKLFATEPAPEDSEDQFHDLMRAAKRLPRDQYDSLSELIKREKWVGAKNLKKAEKEAERDIKDEKAKARVKAANQEFVRNESTYFVEGSCYMRSYLDGKGNRSVKELTNFTVDILEEIFEYRSKDGDEDDKDKTVENLLINGRVNLPGKSKPLHVQGDLWQRGSDAMFGELIKAAGTDLIYERGDCEHIRICINHFSKDTKAIRKRTQDIGHMKINRELCYMMPSTMVTKDAITPNNEFEISFKDDASKPLDFKILDDSQFKDLALHVINDYFQCNTGVATMTCFAHAMASTVMSLLPMKKSPLIFMSGAMSSGKSFIAEAAQCFFGPFESFTNVNSSGKGKLQLAHQFRDALFLIDDYKAAIAEFGGRELMSFIQQVYDRSGRSVLTRASTLREKSPRARGLVLITGQDIPEKEDSVISRMLMVEVPGNGRTQNRDRGERVHERRKEYCGFTPYFIQYVYNLETSYTHGMFKDYVREFEGQAAGVSDQVDGVRRIAENLALNMTAFVLAMEMLVAKGVIDVSRQDALVAQHRKNMLIIRTEIYSYVRSQKGVSVFLDTVRSMIHDPARYTIHGLPGQYNGEHKNAHPIGFYKESDPGVVYLIVGTVYAEAYQLVARSGGGKLHPQNTIGKQLEDEGHIPAGKFDQSSSNKSRNVVNPDNGAQVRCWAIRTDSLGLEEIFKKKDLPKPLTAAQS